MNKTSLSKAYYIISYNPSTTTKATFGLCEAVAVEVIVNIEELRLHTEKVEIFFMTYCLLLLFYHLKL